MQEPLHPEREIVDLHRQTKGAATDMFYLTSPRHTILLGSSLCRRGAASSQFDPNRSRCPYAASHFFNSGSPSGRAIMTPIRRGCCARAASGQAAAAPSSSVMNARRFIRTWSASVLQGKDSTPRWCRRPCAAEFQPRPCLLGVRCGGRGAAREFSGSPLTADMWTNAGFRRYGQESGSYRSGPTGRHAVLRHRREPDYYWSVT